MSSKKTVQHIPEGSNELIEKFINCMMKDGKKSIARRIFKDAMEILKKQGKNNPISIFEKAIENVKPNKEIKARRVGGSVYQIPMEVKPKRRMTLSIRWIIQACRSKKGKSMAEHLAHELSEASNEMGSAFKKREDVHRMAAANKAFAHFARYQ